MLQPDTILNGRYRLLDRLGEGGMATVYRAVDARLGRNVAIKVLHTQYAHDEPFLQRFQQEAEFAASLGSYPNIVAIYDVGQDDIYHYIVMELIDGRNLKELIRERAPFSIAEAFGIGQQVAAALDFAHKRGLVHRDVKPQNIMVTPDGVAKVTDFGIARTASASQLTRTGMVIGTVHYFSPEQAQGKPAGPPSDIYSLGVIVYEMLTAHLPFDAETPIGVAMQHLHSPPPSPWDFQPDLPTRAVSTVMRALEKDPERRYRDAAEFASALSTPPAAEVASTTRISPIPARPAERTGVYQTFEAPRRVIERPRIAPVAREEPDRRRLVWIAFGLAALIAAVIAGSLFATGHLLAGNPPATATATVTATATARPTPKPKPRPTPRPTLPVVIVPSFTNTPIPQVYPTATFPLPTFTPQPTSTPRPLPTPSPTPIPIPTATSAPPPPTPTPTPLG